jgi:hypothetical protein
LKSVVSRSQNSPGEQSRKKTKPISSSTIHNLQTMSESNLEANNESNDNSVTKVWIENDDSTTNERNRGLDLGPLTSSSGRSKKWILVIVVVVIVVSVVVGVVLTPVDKGKEATPVDAEWLSEFIHGLPRYSLEAMVTNPNSPQAKALAWLQKDPHFNDYEDYRLYQRFALAVLYYSTNGDSWESWYRDQWLSNKNECLWNPNYSDGICGRGSRLTNLDLLYNGMDGSVPAELSLLTDLEYMFLGRSDLTGTIHSEL